MSVLLRASTPLRTPTHVLSLMPRLAWVAPRQCGLGCWMGRVGPRPANLARFNATTSATSSGSTEIASSAGAGEKKEEEVKGWRAWIPSRGWSIFFFITGSITTLAVYDNRSIDRIQDRLCDEARANIAALPSGMLERPRKVIVCLGPGDWSRQWFDKYVKPVFDAAAVDYHIVHPSRPGHLRARVRDYIWAGKTQPDLSAPPPPPPVIWYNPLTWFPPSETPEDFILRSSAQVLQPYHGEDGLVCLGPESYRETLQGLNAGILHRPWARPEKRYVQHPRGTTKEDISAYDKEVEEAEREYQNMWLYPSALERDEEAAAGAMEVPVVGYVPARNYVGWFGFPRRVVGWFMRRYVAEEVGAAALQICYGNVRPFEGAVDYALGKEDAKDFAVTEEGTEYEHGGWDQREWVVWDEMDAVVADRLRVYF
ncbi:inner membrane protein import complex subunit Tim54-domain-containing protein [Chytriomyces sp. MP71]|nr:inner membrane protein import complex subunit Tim54-domain-containing protein [Chytriomyces sp. MP71]